MTMWGTVRELFRSLFGASPVLPEQVVHDASGPPRVTFRATVAFLRGVRADLKRPHAFAHERVGFVTARAARGAEGIVLIAEDYYPVADQDYLRDQTVGAMIGPEALRKALELALIKGVSVFHIHMHGLSPRLWFSAIDLREQAKFVPDFFKVCPQMPHGAIVLNAETAAGRVWLAADRVVRIDEFDSVGPRMIINRAADDGSTGFYL
jgi:hypothetical protein